MKKLILLTLFCFSVFAQDQIWKVRAGKRIVFGPKELPGKIHWTDPNLEQFCQSTKNYLEGYLKDFKKYHCQKITNYNQTYCNVLKRELLKPNRDNFPFGTEVEQLQTYSFKAELPFDVEQTKRKLAKEFSVSVKDVVFLNNWTEADPGQISLNSQFEGFFSSLLALSKEELSIQSESAGQGTTDNRYLACSVLEKEYYLGQKLGPQNSIIEEKLEASKLDALWSVNQKLKRFWKDLATGQQSNSFHQLLYLGAEMKVQQKSFPYSHLEIGSLEHWFDKFFSVKASEPTVEIRIKDFSSMSNFESNLYPPKRYKVKYQFSLKQDDLQ
jgi:hypothetical protein